MTGHIPDQERDIAGLERILGSMRGFLYVVSVKDNGLTTYQSPSIRNFLGTDASENIGNPDYNYPSFIHPDDRAGADQIFQAAMKERRGWDMDYRLRRIDGSYSWVREIGTPYFDASGAAETLEGMVIDIDDRKQRELASERRNASLLELFRASHEQARRILSVLGKLRMLGLNARIEAARAGSAGLGFSVVAQELGALSTETIASTEAILAASKQMETLAAGG
jgi:PAS domain S-box-containing protein